MRANLVCAGHWSLVLVKVMKANVWMIGLTPRANQCYDLASQAIECLRRYDGVPCWDLEAPRPLKEDAERAVGVSGSEVVRDGRNLATGLLFQLIRTAVVVQAWEVEELEA